MQSKLMLAMVLAALVVGCDGGCGELPGNGIIVENTVEVGPFTGVLANLGFEANVTVGPESSVTIRGDENLLADMQLSVGDDGVLSAWWGVSVPPVPTQPIVLTVTTPTLIRAGAEGQSKLVASGIQAASFSAEVSNSSQLVLSGVVEGLFVEAWDHGRVQAQELPSRVASVSLRDMADVTLQVAQDLTGSVVGGSSLTVHGKPRQVDIIVSEDSHMGFE